MKEIKPVYIHNIKFDDTDKFTKQFNLCSDLFGSYFNMKHSDEKANKIFEQFLFERWRLETGSY